MPSQIKLVNGDLVYVDGDPSEVSTKLGTHPMPMFDQTDGKQVYVASANVLYVREYTGSRATSL